MKGKIEIDISESAIFKWLAVFGSTWGLLVIGLLLVVPILYAIKLKVLPAGIAVVGVNLFVLLFIITVLGIRRINDTNKVTVYECTKCSAEWAIHGDKFPKVCPKCKSTEIVRNK